MVIENRIKKAKSKRTDKRKNTKISLFKRRSRVFPSKKGKQFDRKVEFNTRILNDTRTQKAKESSSKKERRANALASGADEGRDKLR